MPYIIFRTDANSQIGTGHLMRCIAFAEHCKEKSITPIFVLAMQTSLEERLRKNGIDVRKISSQRGSAEDAEDTIDIAEKLEASWIITDGYDFDLSYQNAIRNSGLTLLVIDDYAHLSSYNCDLLLNQNIGVDASLYDGKTDAQLLLDTKYVLLRSEFLSYKNFKRSISETAFNILVTLGGADVENVTEKVLRALINITDHTFHVQVIIGAENPRQVELEDIASQSSHDISFAKNVTDMSERMAWADLAIGAAGSTSWEFLFMGVPCITGVLAENQEGIAAELDHQKLAKSVGWYRDISVEDFAMCITDLVSSQVMRKKFSNAGRECIDGMGVTRVVERMRDF